MFTPFHSRRRVLGWAASLTAISMMHSAWAARNVQVDRVVHGTASFATSGSLTTITASNHAIINYKQFDIADGQTVQFVQPSRVSKVLNRIASNAPSLLDGSLLANGIVYFVNPAGVMFGPHSIVSVGGIIAAAGNITDNDFSNNVDHFSGTGSLVNNGTINAGNAQLVGQSVANHGVINAPGGLVAMVAGQDVMLGTSSSNILVKIGTTNSQGGVSNDGTVNAAGGQATLVSGDIYSMALGTPSVIKANQVTVQGGSVAVSGKIDATNSAGNGGAVTVTGQTIALQSADIDASGSTGGGTIKVGGDFHAAADLPLAQTTSVSSDSTLRADATVNGNGGQVAVWSSLATSFAGTISARGAGAGTGGFAEISSKGTLSYPGIAYVGGPGGPGSVLLDPATFDIAPSTSGGSDATGSEIANDVIASSGNYTVSADTEIFVHDTIDISGTTNTLTLDAPTIDFNQPVDINLASPNLLGSSAVLVANVHNGGLIQNGIDVFSAPVGGANPTYPMVNIDGGSYDESVIVREGNSTSPISFAAQAPVTVNSLTVNSSCPAYFNGTFTATNGFTINEAIYAGIANNPIGKTGTVTTLIGPMTVHNDGNIKSDGSIDANSITLVLMTDSLTMDTPAQIDNNFSGQGTVVIEPQTNSTPINIGDTTPPPGPGLNIDPIDNIGGNLALVVIGSPTGSGAITINNPSDNTTTSTFTSPVTIQSPAAGGSITVNGAYLKGAFNNLGALTLDAPTITINAPIIMSYQRSTVQVEGSTTLAADITTDYSTVTFTGDVTLGVGANVSIDTTNGNQTTGPAAAGADISLVSISNGNGGSLTLNAGNAGTISFSGNIDNVANLTITNSDGATFGGTLGAGTPGNVTISDSQNAAVIAFDGGANILTLTADGASLSYIINFNAAAGGQSSTVATASLSNTSGISLGNDTGDSINFTNGLNYQAGTTEAIGTITTTGSANIDLGMTIFSDTTTFTAGATTFHGPVSGDVALTINGNAAFDSTLATLVSLHVTGNTSMTPASLTTSGAQEYDGDLNLFGGAAESFTASTFTVGGALTGDGNGLTINSDATLHAITAVGALQINGNATFDGIINVGSITVADTTAAAGSITTAGDQNYDGALTLTADTTFTATDEGAINFHSSVDSGPTPQSLTIDITDTGTATFYADIGDTHPLANLYSTPGGKVVFGNSGDDSTIAISTVTASSDGQITFNNAVTLAANTTITARAIDFNGTLDSDSVAPRNLTITAAPGMLTFDGLFTSESLTAGAAAVTFHATGQTHELGNVIINAAVPSTAYAIDLNAGAYNYTNATFTSPVILTADTTITAAGNVDFQSTIDSDSTSSERVLTISATGTTTFAGDVGDNAPLASLTVSSTGGIDLNAAEMNVVQAQTFSSPVSLSANTSLRGTSDVMFASTITGNGFNLTIDAASTTFSGAASGIGTLNVSGDASVAANISTTGPQSFDNFAMENDVVLTGDGISLGAIGSGVTAYALTLSAGGGAIAVSGSTNYISLLTIANASGASFGAVGNTGPAVAVSISQSTGTIAFGSATYLSTHLSTLTAAAGAYAISFAGSTTIDNAVTFNNTGGVTLGSAASSVTLLSGGATNTVGPTTAIGSIAANGAPLTLAALSLAGDTTLDTTDSGASPSGAAITIASIAGNSHNLTLNPGTSAINVTGNTDAVALLTITDSGGATFGGSFGATQPGAVTITDTVAGDTITFDGSANITTFTAAATSNAYNIAFNAAPGGQTSVITTANIANTGSITLGNDPADQITFTNGFSSTNPNISLSGTLTAANNPITIGSITIANNATIAAGDAAVSLSAANIAAGDTLTLGFGNPGPITLGTAAGASSSNPSNLTFNTTGIVSVTGAIGPNIGNLTITNSGGATFAAAVTANAVTLTNTTGAIAFNNSLTAATLTDTAGSFNLQILGDTSITNAVTLGTTGTVTFGSGGTALAFNGGITHTAGPDILNGDLSSTNATIDLDLQVTGNSTIDAGPDFGTITLGDTTLSDGVTLALGAGDVNEITVASIAGGKSSGVVINTTGVVEIDGAIGSTDAPIGSLTSVNSGGAVFNEIHAAGDISITANDVTVGGVFFPGVILLNGDVTAGGNIILQPGTTLTGIPGALGAYTSGEIEFYGSNLTAGGNISLAPTGDTPLSGINGSDAAIVNTPSVANIVAFGPAATVNGFQGIALNIQAASLTMGPSTNLLVYTGGLNISVSKGTTTLSNIVARGSVNISASGAADFSLVNHSQWGALTSAGDFLVESGTFISAAGINQPDILSLPATFPSNPNFFKYALAFATPSASASPNAFILSKDELLDADNSVYKASDGTLYFLSDPYALSLVPYVQPFTAIPMVDQQLIKGNVIFDSAMRKQFWRLGLDGRDTTLDTIDGDGFRAPDDDQVQMSASAYLAPPATP